MSRAAKRPEQAALFGDDIPQAAPAPRANDRPEAAALAEVLQVLKHHPVVAWVERQNSGVARIGGRFVRFGWPGCSDVLGQLKDGRLLAVECKAPKGKATDEQTQFLSLVRRFGGVAFLARDCRDVLRELAGDEAKA
ncbi:MAG: VRR-NUC domain-containing protein [Candidatus Accumulibacter sp.]|uniref:VRR-NUC domain-containing protein n=1 Tax=Accumulibacter sp. TaxID=2053492 RepID=UPI0025888102|nr:VRR-NUC domain-containing protein [Accumulibacter sp.]MCM8623267.1 VRR-NUC domain-containing protein [Accumulibacter sp.]